MRTRAKPGQQRGFPVSRSALARATSRALVLIRHRDVRVNPGSVGLPVYEEHTTAAFDHPREMVVPGYQRPPAAPQPSLYTPENAATARFHDPSAAR